MIYVSTVILALALLVCTYPALSTDIQRAKEHLPGITTAQTIFVEATVPMTTNSIKPNIIRRIFTRRMEEMGFTITTKNTVSHDVMVKIICEDPTQPKGKEPSRLPKMVPPKRNKIQGPPCFMAYHFHGRPIPWQNINRVVYSEGVNVAKQIALQHPETDFSHTIPLYLEQYDFPLLLSAEWGQAERLIQTFYNQETTDERKSRIISLLGETHPPLAFQFLVNILQDDAFAPESARALGHFGGTAKPYLTSLLKNAETPKVQAAAANGLGQIGAMTGDPSTTLLFLELLTRPDIDMAVQTEIVWALGKSPDFAAHPVLAELEKKVWLVRSKDPQLQKLRQAVDWSIREVRQGGHTDEY